VSIREVPFWQIDFSGGFGKMIQADIGKGFSVNAYLSELAAGTGGCYDEPGTVGGNANYGWV
jgi:hypothetical protein